MGRLVHCMYTLYLVLSFLEAKAKKETRFIMHTYIFATIPTVKTIIVFIEYRGRYSII